MTHRLRFRLFLLAVAVTAWAACRKSSGSGAPNAGSFNAYPVAAYTFGSYGVVGVQSQTLAAGSYTVKYSYYSWPGSGASADTIKNVSATLVMSDHTGSFQSPVITDTNALATYIIIDSIISRQGIATAVKSGNHVALSDSTGLMTATMGDNAFRATYVTVDTNFNNEGELTVYSQYFLPGSTEFQQFVFVLYSYRQRVGAYPLPPSGMPGSGWLWDYSGSVTVDTVTYGSVTITSTSPMVAGSFSMTCADSMKITGSFSVPAHP